MAIIEFRGNQVSTSGELPALGSSAPEFRLTTTELADVSLATYAGKKVILNIFPSIDTPVCASSVRRFNSEAARAENAVILCISRDLPFAQKRFCGAEGIENVVPLSAMRDSNFGRDYGVLLESGALAGLFARAIVVLGEDGKVIYTELVRDIAREPNYESALASIR